MDHGHYAYAPSHRRRAARWPNGARVAFSVLLHLEHWEADPGGDALRDPRFVGEFGTFTPDYRTYSYRAYGNRVGVFRILALLDALRLPVTVALGAALPPRAPELVAAIVARGWSIIGHGWSANAMVSSRMGDNNERDFVARCLADVTSAIGRPVRGWRSQDFGTSAATPAILAEAGLDFVVDWPNDDGPYWMATPRPMVSVPIQAELDDVELLWHRRMPPVRYPALVRDYLDGLAAEPLEGRSVVVGVHPWVTGAAHRFRYLEEALSSVAARHDLWFADVETIADAWRGQVPLAEQENTRC